MMKRVLPVLSILLFVFAGREARGEGSVCRTKTACTKKASCEDGHSLVQAGPRKFYCQKVSTEVADRQALACDRGSLVKVDGVDYCKWSASRLPECAAKNGNNDWEWNKTEKKCRRVANNGDVKWATDNIDCDDLAYDASTGRCSGTRREMFTLNELLAKCEAQLSSSVYVQDFDGSTDMCVKLDTTATFQAPSWISP